jgi:NAD(P)-dependent dehydrogenase (short-subunit alcohol dehydrogenase family)
MVAVAGKVVVVTGGRRGLGASLVDEVLARGARKVYSTARAAYTDDREEVVTHELEVRSPDSVAALAAIATDAEIVFNNAGVLLPESLLTGSFDDVTETFDVNVFGPLRVTRAFAPILAANGGGAVVNMHSVLSWLAGAGAYGASKAAMWSVTNSLRAELEPEHPGRRCTRGVHRHRHGLSHPGVQDDAGRGGQAHRRRARRRCRGGAHRRQDHQRQGCAVRSCGAPDLRIGPLTNATEEH